MKLGIPLPVSVCPLCALPGCMMSIRYDDGILVMTHLHFVERAGRFLREYILTLSLSTPI